MKLTCFAFFFNTFVVTADPTAPFQNSVQYFLHLSAFGVQENRLSIFPKGEHGFGIYQGFAPDAFECCSWPTMAIDWLNRRIVQRF